MTPAAPFALPRNPEAFFADLDALTAQVQNDRQPSDITHTRRIETWGRLFTLAGYGTAWLGVNPIAILGIGLGMSCRWMIMAHHVLHRGYDAYPNAPRRWRSAVFGRGWRRWIDWCDWIPVKAWVREHNALHHYRLGEVHDPDLPENNLAWLADARLPRPVKYAILAFGATTWKWSYYGPSVIQASLRHGKSVPSTFSFWSPATWKIWHPVGRRVWFESWLPHLILRFGLMPLLFLPFGKAAWAAVLINSLLAELFTNIHTFLVILPNHAGDDVPRFSQAPRDKRELQLRQIIGSVNYRTGTDSMDFLHGWLNYQIEHHLWPDLSLAQYQRWQPHLRALCEKHGVTYTQENLGIRVRKMAENVVGKTKMPVLASLPLSSESLALSS